MKKGLALCMTAVLAMGCLLTGCGSSDTGAKSTTGSAAAGTEAAETETAGTEAAGTQTTDGEKKTFTVGFDASFPPYGYQENGEYVGFDLDLAQEVCSRNNWELVKMPIDWDSKDMELNSGTISCIWNGFTMNGREDDYTWSDPYVDNSQVFVVKSDSGITTFDDLSGKTVAVQTDSSAEAALNEEDNAALKDSFKELLVVGEYNTAFLNLESNAVDAIAMDIGVAKYQLESRNGDFTILDQPLAAEQYAVGFKKGNETLRDQVQNTLNEMKSDGTFKTIAEKWDLQDSVILD